MSRTFPLLLSFELLDALELGWRSAGWPGIEGLNPGLTDEEIDAMTEPIGIRLPVDVRTWWRWHDGISAPAGLPGQPVFGAAGRWYPSLSAAIREYSRMRDLAARAVDDEIPGRTTQEAWWPQQLFPITATSAGTVTACDCSVRAHAPSPVHTVDFHDGPAGPPRAASLGTVVSWWIMAIDTGAWWYDRDEQRWDYDWELAEQARNIGDAI
jgi:cell wall assembly regulator SMI1